MRYVTFVLIPDDGGLHPVDRALSGAESVTREAIHDISLLNDGSAITIYKLAGSADAVEDVLDGRPEVRTHNVTAMADSVHAYVQFEPNDVVETLLDIPREHELVIDTPMMVTDRGGLRVTVVGTEAKIRQAIPELPDSLRPKLEHTGDYEPESDRLFSVLTDRQQDILRTAVEEGYYAVPREATHEDLARKLDCSKSNVGELMRRIEATILTEVTPY